MKQKALILFFLFQLVVLGASAQNHLKVKEIFDKYGKQEGAVLVQLSSDVLAQGSNLTFYKSLMLDAHPAREQDLLNALNQDIRNGQIVSEVKKGGKVESGTYLVGMSGKASEFILYKNKSGKIVLVYLKGNFRPNQLSDELKKLKDLFIYVNNKRLKIQ
ncbi:MAG: hypothetical protein BGN96_17690 [Bacteroidales bacterium 45-6]|nr:MAG: hypothetical protein BGN96_17690 [Bacteroidales bacterium 45-6]